MCKPVRALLIGLAMTNVAYADHDAWHPGDDDPFHPELNLWEGYLTPHVHAFYDPRTGEIEVVGISGVNYAWAISSEGENILAVSSAMPTSAYSLILTDEGDLTNPGYRSIGEGFNAPGGWLLPKTNLGAIIKPWVAPGDLTASGYNTMVGGATVDVLYVVPFPEPSSVSLAYLVACSLLMIRLPRDR